MKKHMKKIIDCQQCHHDCAVLRTETYPNNPDLIPSYLIQCNYCGHSTLYYDDKDRAIEAWNRESLDSLLDNVEDYFVTSSFDSIIAIKDFDEDIYAFRFPTDSYTTCKAIFSELAKEMCSLKNKQTGKPYFTKEELCEIIKGN